MTDRTISEEVRRKAITLVEQYPDRAQEVEKAKANP
jgi:hypothetical protein